MDDSIRTTPVNVHRWQVCLWIMTSTAVAQDVPSKLPACTTYLGRSRIRQSFQLDIVAVSSVKNELRFISSIKLASTCVVPDTALIASLARVRSVLLTTVAEIAVPCSASVRSKSTLDAGQRPVKSGLW